MKAIKIIVTILSGSLLAAIAWATWQGDGWAELKVLLTYPWFIMSLVDVYAGFLLFCLWVWFRESSLSRKLLLTLAIMLLGNLLACVYVLLQLSLSGGDWNKFWMGARANERSSEKTASQTG